MTIRVLIFVTTSEKLIIKLRVYYYYASHSYVDVPVTTKSCKIELFRFYDNNRYNIEAES